ncbi:MAG TPA: hypothetical protein VHT03_15205 [Rhizomicrobium sp.]|jgi:hypothetical protein|nr:hypothetical protein [Rhizomicrobium sp.]
MNALPRICCVMASDAPFFHQTRASLETFDSIRKSVGAEVKVIALDLDRSQTDWLTSRGIQFATDVEARVPRFAEAPLHTIAMSCRPYIPELFPGYDAYMWIDSDIRFLHPYGFQAYLEALTVPGCSVAIAPETEPAYCINQSPDFANAYHRQKYARLRVEFGEEMARHLEFTAMFNAGIFSAPAKSPLWARYKYNLEKMLVLPYERMREQDAMLVSIIEVQGLVRMSSLANWLCSMRMPVRHARAEGPVFVNPEDPAKQILVAHLTNSSDPLTFDGKQQTIYNLYQKLGLTV